MAEFREWRLVFPEVARGKTFPDFRGKRRPKKNSGQRESNPHSQLGRLEFYH